MSLKPYVVVKSSLVFNEQNWSSDHYLGHKRTMEQAINERRKKIVRQQELLTLEISALSAEERRLALLRSKFAAENNSV